MVGLMSNKVKVVGEWNDSLIWCPSQCELPLVTASGKNYTLYLRWRWDDPWSASLIPMSDEREDWIRLNIPYFTDEQLEDCKREALRVAVEVLNGKESENV